MYCLASSVTSLKTWETYSKITRRPFFFTSKGQCFFWGSSKSSHPLIAPSFSPVNRCLLPVLTREHLTKVLLNTQYSEISQVPAPILGRRGGKGHRNSGWKGWADKCTGSRVFAFPSNSDYNKTREINKEIVWGPCFHCRYLYPVELRVRSERRCSHVLWAGFSLGSALAELTLHSAPRPLLSQQDMLPVAWQVSSNNRRHAPVLHAVAVEHPAAPMAVQGVHEHLQAARSWNTGTEILHSRLHSGPVVELAQNVKTGRSQSLTSTSLNFSSAIFYRGTLSK